MKDTSVHNVWIGLGTNLGDRALNLSNSRKAIEELDCRIVSSSSVYESAPWGYQSSNAFYNQCLVIETNMDPYNLLKSFKAIEAEFGRTKNSDRYEDRPIDIDILFYDDQVMNSEYLVIPHAGIAKRNFVLIPLREIDPGKMHPVLKQSIADLAEVCEDQQQLVRLTGK